MRWLLALAALILPALGHSSCPASDQSHLAIIIDDIGYHRDRGMAFAELPVPLTLSVIPATPHGREVAAAALARGKEIMVHMPMASHHRPITDSLTLVEDLEDGEFERVLNEAITQVPGATGMNNHMGSALTENSTAMNKLMVYLARREFFFIDSRTTSATVAAQIAQAHNIPFASRAVFLDNTREASEIANKLTEAVEIARAQGQVIAIGHAFPETLTLLTQALAHLPTDVLLTPASTIARCRATQSLTSIP
jgi:polysaccharide deacetylase 2 family uncharacterized protein YibQ